MAGVVPRGPEPGQLNLDDHTSRAERRIMSLGSCYALVAASEALRQAHWSPKTEEEKCRSGKVCFLTSVIQLLHTQIKYICIYTLYYIYIYFSKLFKKNDIFI